MIARYFLSLLAASTSVFALQADGASTQILVKWTSDSSSPGVSVESARWFVSVVPSGLSLESLAAPRLVFGERSKESRILHVDPEQRLCLLEADAPFEGVEPTPLSGTASLRAGQKLHCLSGETGCLTLVAGKDWCYRGKHFPLPYLRLRVADSTAPCGAGTPLLDNEGGLAGILTDRRLEDSGEIHAIPVSRVRKVVEDMKRHNRSGPVWVGLVFHNESSTPDVIEVKADSPAEEADLRPGDVVLELDGTEIDSLDDLVEIFHNLPAGEEVAVRVLRGLTEETLSVTPRFAELSAASR